VPALLGTERVRELLVGRWGLEVASDGEIDRGRVGAIVFESPEELAWLEATLHPLVGEQIVAWRQGLDPSVRVAVVEVPLLFESDLDAAFDATVAVVAPDPVRAERAGARGTLDLEGRERRQLSQSDKAVRATYVIDNDSGLDRLEERVGELIAELTEAEDDRG
jgi:dephospho-CoA kinase